MLVFKQFADYVVGIIFADLRHCRGDLGFALAPDGKRLILVSCLDNLLKGASGQAVQNLNLMCGWNEEEGLL